MAQWQELLSKALAKLKISVEAFFQEAGKAANIAAAKVKRAIARYQENGSLPEFVKIKLEPYI